MTSRRPWAWAPRWWHRRFAAKKHYFWLPCPLCSQMFGGHEWRMVKGRSADIQDPKCPDDPRRRIGICPKCTKAGRGDEYRP